MSVLNNMCRPRCQHISRVLGYCLFLNHRHRIGTGFEVLIAFSKIVGILAGFFYTETFFLKREDACYTAVLRKLKKHATESATTVLTDAKKARHLKCTLQAVQHRCFIETKKARN